MAAPSNKAVLATLLLVGVAVSSGVVFLDDVLADSWSENGVRVQSADGPNGEYATIGSGGTVTVALDGPGVNPQSLTIVRRVFVASNRGENWTRVWVTADDPGRVSVVDERTGAPVLGAENAMLLAPGDRFVATLRFDTRANASAPSDVLLQDLTVHTEPIEPPRPKRTPTTVTITTTADAPNSSRASFAVDFGPGIGTVNVTVDPVPVEALTPEDTASDRAPTPIIWSESDPTTRLSIGSASGGGPSPDGGSTAGEIRVNGTPVDVVVPARTVVSLDGTRSVIPTATGIDSRLHVAAAADVTVPRALRNHPAVLRFSVPRHRFGGRPPEDARIGHQTPTGWELLDTRVVDRTRDSVVLEARTPGFSRFAVFTTPDVTYRWDLPGQRDVVGGRIETVFQDPGLHEVSLAVSTDQGQTAATDAVVLANDRPRIHVDRPANVTAGESVRMRAEITDRFGNTSVTWVLPDGRIVSGETATHTFEPGTRRVTVHVADEFGANVTTTETIEVSPPSGAEAGSEAGFSGLPELAPAGASGDLDLAILIAALIGGAFLVGIVAVLVLFGMGLIRVGDREDDVLVAAFRGHATLGSGLEDDGPGAERAITGLFDDEDDASGNGLLDADAWSGLEGWLGDTDPDSIVDPITEVFDGDPGPGGGVQGVLAGVVLVPAAAIRAVVRRLRVASTNSSRRPSRGGGRGTRHGDSTWSFSLSALRRHRGPEVTAFHDPTWDPARNRFVIGTLAVAHPDRDLATVEITIVDADGEPLARKTVNLQGRGVYRASPELVPGVPEAEVAGTNEYAIQIRVVDRRSNVATVRQRVSVPNGVRIT